jgi:hypothetical protein
MIILTLLGMGAQYQKAGKKLLWYQYTKKEI